MEEGKYNGTLFYTEVSAESMAKGAVQLSIHRAFDSWRAKNPLPLLVLPSVLQKGKDDQDKDKDTDKEKEKSAQPQGQAEPAPQGTKQTIPPLESHGKFLFQGKIAELEDRIISAGLVGNPDDLDLADPFIDDHDCEQDVRFCL